MVEVDGVSLEDVEAAGRSRVDILVDFPGVEWCGVVIADGEGDCVGGRWLEANSPAHQVLSEGLLCGVAKMETSATSASSKGPGAASPPARRSRVVAGTIVGGGHLVGYVG